MRKGDSFNQVIKFFTAGFQGSVLVHKAFKCMQIVSDLYVTSFQPGRIWLVGATSGRTETLGLKQNFQENVTLNEFDKYTSYFHNTYKVITTMVIRLLDDPT